MGITQTHLLNRVSITIQQYQLIGSNAVDHYAM